MWTILVIAVGLSSAAGLAVVGHAWYVIHQERLRLHWTQRALLYSARA
jgi:hypothetical protein